LRNQLVDAKSSGSDAQDSADAVKTQLESQLGSDESQAQSEEQL